MADSLDNFDYAQYAGIGGLGSAVKGFAQGWQDGEDRKMKRLEMESKLEAQKTEKERNAFLDQMTAREKGYQKGPNGELQEAPLSSRQQSGKRLDEFKAGAKATGYDAEGNPTGYEYDPSTLKAKEAEARAAAARAVGGNRSDLIETRHDKMDRAEHENVLRRVAANPQVKQRLTQFQNLDNSLSQLANADHVTPQMFAEVQQSIRSNLGVKGSSGVGEREEAYMKSLGLNSANMMQFLSGNPANIGPNDPLLMHIKNLAKVEQQNIRKQFDQSLKAASGGHSSMYSRRPDLRGDLEDYLSGIGGQMDSQVPPQAAAEAPTEPSQGLLSRAKGLFRGLLGSAPAQAGTPQAVPDHPQDAEAIAWAKANLQSKDVQARVKAKNILEANGVK